MTETTSSSTLNNDLEADCDAVMLEYFWIKKKYDEYVDYFECYNLNRHAYRGPVTIDSFDEWLDANQQTIERRYEEFLSASG